MTTSIITLDWGVTLIKEIRTEWRENSCDDFWSSYNPHIVVGASSAVEVITYRIIDVLRGERWEYSHDGLPLNQCQLTSEVDQNPDWLHSGCDRCCPVPWSDEFDPDEFDLSDEGELADDPTSPRRRAIRRCRSNIAWYKTPSGQLRRKYFPVWEGSAYGDRVSLTCTLTEPLPSYQLETWETGSYCLTHHRPGNHSTRQSSKCKCPYCTDFDYSHRCL